MDLLTKSQRILKVHFNSDLLLKLGWVKNAPNYARKGITPNI